MTSLSSIYDVVVVGAGPAGLAAAVSASAAGASVALLDAGLAPGGQYWRHPADTALARAVDRHHHDLKTYRSLRSELAAHERSGRLVVLQRHTVWTIAATTDGFSTRAVDESATPATESVIASRALVLAPGAYDRQVPFPGWELPGVMAAGGVQALLKGNDTVVGSRILVAGTGPFLMSVGAGLAAAGGHVVGVHETSVPWRWLPHLRAVVGSAGKLREGAGYLATFLRHRVPYVSGSTVIEAHGRDRLESVTVARVDVAGRVRPGSERRIDVDTLAVGWGFTPQLELPLALGCASRLDVDGSVVIEVDANQQSSVPGVFVAGEACGVGGAELAVVEGRIAGESAAGATPGSARVGDVRTRSRRRAFARAMHEVYPTPPGWVDRLRDDTVVCRCEEVPAGRLRGVAEDPATASPRSAKLLVRTGMGWCQGRMCGYAIACIISRAAGTEFAPGQLAERTVAIPLTIGLLGDEPAADVSRNPSPRPVIENKEPL